MSHEHADVTACVPHAVQGGTQGREVLISPAGRREFRRDHLEMLAGLDQVGGPLLPQ